MAKRCRREVFSGLWPVQIGSGLVPGHTEHVVAAVRSSGRVVAQHGGRTGLLRGATSDAQRPLKAAVTRLLSLLFCSPLALDQLDLTDVREGCEVVESA